MERYRIRRERKEILKNEIEKQRDLIQKEDFRLMSDENNEHNDEHDNRLIELNKQLNIIKLELEELRLQGDRFYVLNGDDTILMDIDETSKITFYLCTHFTDLTKIPIEESNESRILIINESETISDPSIEPIFEFQKVISSKSIHQLFSVKTNFDSNNNNNNNNTNGNKPSLLERVKQNTWSLGISPLRRTTSDPTIFGERFSPPKSISNFIERFKDNKDKDNKDKDKDKEKDNSSLSITIQNNTTTTTTTNITTTTTNNTTVNTNNIQDKLRKYSTTSSINNQTNNQNIENNNNNHNNNNNNNPNNSNNNQEINGKILLTWSNKETSMYILKTQEESLELLELLGSHIDRSKKVTAKQSQTIKVLFQKKSTIYESTNPDHEEYLKHLWTLLYPDQEFQKKSPLWKKFGFQSDDPTRDFRGMGIMGLLNLIHLVQHHNDWVQEILAQDRDYPFAVAGINISNLIFEVFQISEDSLQQPWYSSFWSSSYMAMLCSMSRHNDHAFEELYFLIFNLLDHLWIQMNATYMMFPLVIKKLKSQLNEISNFNPNSFDEVRARFDLIQRLNIIDNPIEQQQQQPQPQQQQSLPLPSSPRSFLNNYQQNNTLSPSISPPKNTQNI
ncbi:hypothetical protein ACTFIU_000031 [Dictyostelium citrinum]